MQNYHIFTIKNGTVIDHIPAGLGVKIITLLNALASDSIVTMGARLPSKKIGRKDLIKFENRELNPEEINQICLIAPQASISLIRNNTVYKKLRVELPSQLKNVARCPNAKCITNHEAANTKFNLLISQSNKSSKEKYFACHYCEKQFTPTELAEKILA